MAAGLPIDTFLERIDKPPLRVAGTAIFITPRLDEVPGALLHNMKHNKVLHERVIFLRVDVQDVPFVPYEKRLTVNKLGKGFYTVEVHYGFFQTPRRAPGAGRRAGLRAFDRCRHDDVLHPPRDAGARARIRDGQMADQDVHQALRFGVAKRRSSTACRRAAWWSSARRPRSRSHRVDERLQIRGFRQHGMHRMIGTRARLTDEAAERPARADAGGTFEREAFGRHVVRAGRQHQETAGRHERRGEPRELAIGARARLDVLARRRKRRRIGDDDIETLTRFREPFELHEDVRLPERAELIDAVRSRGRTRKIERRRRRIDAGDVRAHLRRPRARQSRRCSNRHRARACRARGSR